MREYVRCLDSLYGSFGYRLTIVQFNIEKCKQFDAVLMHNFTNSGRE